jgi:hypothetical protein
MSEHTYYICTKCGKKGTIFPINHVTMRASRNLPPSMDFCSKECFREYFDEVLKDVNFNDVKVKKK